MEYLMKNKLGEDKIERFEKDEKESSTIIPFKLLTGGKDGDNTDWLRTLPVGSIIVIGKKNLQDPFTLEVVITHRSDKTVKLENPSKKFDERVVPHKFYNQFHLIEVLGTIENLDKEDGKQ